MHQIKTVKKDFHEGQFEYLGRWVNKEHFRTVVYNQKDEQRLANSYNEFESLIASGIWFASKPIASHGRKQKNDTLRATS